MFILVYKVYHIHIYIHIYAAINIMLFQSFVISSLFKVKFPLNIEGTWLGLDAVQNVRWISLVYIAINLIHMYEYIHLKYVWYISPVTCCRLFPILSWVWVANWIENIKYLFSLLSQLAHCCCFTHCFSPSHFPSLFACTVCEVSAAALCLYLPRLSPIYSHLLWQLLPLRCRAVSAKFRAKCSALFLANTVATSTVAAAVAAYSSSSKGCDDLEPASALFEQNWNAPHGEGNTTLAPSRQWVRLYAFYF